MNVMSEKELHEQFVRGVTWKMIGVLVAATISIVSSFWIGYNAIQKSEEDTRSEMRESLQSIRFEFRAQIDTVKANQMQSHYENEIRFKDIEHKIDRK